jgi:hypothetical protein
MKKQRTTSVSTEIESKQHTFSKKRTNVDRFGLAEPAVTHLMSSLTNANKCLKFRPPNGWEVIDD